MICFLQQSYKDSNDFLAETYIKLLSSSYKKPDKAVKLEVIRSEKEIRKSLRNYVMMKEVIKDDRLPDADLRSTLYEKFEKELGEIDNLSLLLSGKYSNTFKLLTEKFRYFRQFTPQLVENLDITLETGCSSDILEAVSVLKEMNREKKRQLPCNPPTKFIPKRLARFVINGDKVDRHAWECALLLKLQEEIRHGNVVLKGGKRFS